jgi:hypothetical protein
MKAFNTVSYIEIYYGGSTAGNSIQVGFTDVSSNDITMENFTTGSIPTGYDVTEFEIQNNVVKSNTFVGALQGTATKATQDDSGNIISSTYLKLSGGTMTGKGIIKWPA